MKETHRIDSEPIGFLSIMIFRVQDDCLECLSTVTCRVVSEVQISNGPSRTKEIERLCKDIVVHQTRVHGEQTHQKDDVSAIEECKEDLIVRFQGNDLRFFDNEIQSKEGHQQSMACISKHDCKQKWKSDDGKRSRVYFLVVCNSICVHNVLFTESQIRKKRVKQIDKEWKKFSLAKKVARED